ncbi:MAG: hypothetical protein NC914_03005, partial [Candidatus Omnitrophica bacterium]|nr:hypothetical protein [Candidatus Omnitrophota bacterium]
MKKKIFLSLAAVLVVLIAVFIAFKERIVLKVARLNIKKTLPISKVEIEKAEFHPFSSLQLKGINIKSPLQKYSIYIKNVRVEYSLISLLKAVIDKVDVSGIDVSISKNIKVKPAKPLFKIKELKAGGTIKFQEFKIQGLGIKLRLLAKDRYAGNLNAEGVTLGKLKISNLNADIEYSNTGLSVPDFRFSAFAGEIKGGISAVLTGPQVDFTLEAEGKNVDLAKLDEDFNLKEKFEVT